MGHIPLHPVQQNIEYKGECWRIFKFQVLHDVVFIRIVFDACRGHRRLSGGSSGGPVGPLGAIREHSGAISLFLMNSLKIVKS